MKRQPFRPPARTSWAIAPHIIEQLPELAALIGRITINWSGVDLFMGVTLGSLLGVESRAAVAVFASLRQHRTQRDALKAAAKATLSEHLLDVFEALLQVHERLDKQRNCAVHGIWGRAEGADGTAIWTSIENHALALNAEYHFEASNIIDGRAERMIADGFSVKYEDLAALNSEIMALAAVTRKFCSYLRYRAEDLMKAIEEDPAMKEALTRVRASKG